MPISWAKRTNCQGCGVPSIRSPRRPCRKCGWKACAACRKAGVCCTRNHEAAVRCAEKELKPDIQWLTRIWQGPQVAHAFQDESPYAMCGVRDRDFGVAIQNIDKQCMKCLRALKKQTEGAKARLAFLASRRKET